MDYSIASLLQVHYHFRIGGVREVICGYSKAFSAINGPGSFNALMCNHDQHDNDSDLKIINITECDYQDPTDKESFFYLRDLLVKKIDSVLEKVPSPVAILCHNMSLAKNPCLSSALRVLARKKDPCKYRFFWVLHDLAEEGRIDMIEKVTRLQSIGIDIREELYALGAPVHFLVPGAHVYSILKNSGFAVSLLPNPLRLNTKVNNTPARTVLLEHLKTLALSDGFTFDPQRPICCYPARIIRRKNVLEAVVIACILLDANLVLGVPGRTLLDRNFYEELIKLLREMKLRVAINTARLPWKLLTGDSEYDGNPVPYLYKTCDLAVSTSLSEGFGYALYEPWLFQKAVLARRPAGFIYPQGMNSSLLYDHFPVPLEWICWKSLKEKYYQYYSRFVGESSAVKAEEHLIVDETIDFGALDTEMQIQVLRKIIADETDKQKMSILFRKMFPGWRGIIDFALIDETLIRKNRDAVMNTYSDQCFRSCFRECISIIPAYNDRSFDYKKILLESWKCGFKLFFSYSGSYNENVTK